MDWSFTIAFTVDYAIRWYATTNPWTYPFGFFPIVDLLACLPVYIQWLAGGSSTQLNFVRFVRVLRVVRVLRAFKALNAAMTPVQKSLLTLSLTFISVLFLGAGLIYTTEIQAYDDMHDGRTREEDGLMTFTFFDAIYYMLVRTDAVYAMTCSSVRACVDGELLHAMSPSPHLPTATVPSLHRATVIKNLESPSPSSVLSIVSFSIPPRR